MQTPRKRTAHRGKLDERVAGALSPCSLMLREDWECLLRDLFHAYAERRAKLGVTEKLLVRARAAQQEIATMNSQDNAPTTPTTIAAEVGSDPEGFQSKITPKRLASADDLFLFKCPCGNPHFRHAGYVNVVMPFVRADKQKRMTSDDYTVNVCTKCRRCFSWVSEQMYEVTDLIDLEAWAKAEVELHKATGPGGQC